MPMHNKRKRPTPQMGNNAAKTLQCSLSKYAQTSHKNMVAIKRIYVSVHLVLVHWKFSRFRLENKSKNSILQLER